MCHTKYHITYYRYITFHIIDLMKPTPRPDGHGVGGCRDCGGHPARPAHGGEDRAGADQGRKGKVLEDETLVIDTVVWYIYTI